MRSDYIELKEGISLVLDYRGKTPKKLGSDWVEDGVRVVSAKNVHDGVLDNLDDIRCVTPSVYKKWMKDEIRRNDILLASEGASMGESMLWESDEKIVLGQRLFGLRCDENILDPFYLAMYIRTPEYRAELENHATGTSVMGLRQPALLGTKIRYIPLAAQKRIGQMYKALNAKVENNKRINDNLLEQMQALYKAWFVDYLPFGGVKPEPWTQADIYSLANIIYGAPFASKQFNTEGNGKPIIRIRDLKDQQFATYTTEVHPKGYLLQPGDIVVGMDGEFRPYIWGNDEAWLNQRVCVFENKRPNGKAFLYFTIKPLLFAIEQTQVATTVIHIGKKDYDAFEITLPDSSTLDSFDSLTSPMITRIVSNSFENKRLATMRDTLLPKLMSGEIDVSGIQL